MSLTIIEQLAAILIGAALLLAVIRMLKGPTAADRIISADTLSVTVTAALTGLAAVLESALFLDIALVYAALSFIGVVAMARIIEGGGA
jgi:multisubunit Na+/H+ antiporter MnhF subunit